MEDKANISVALSYELGEKAPKIIASGRGELAKLIQKIAEENNIKIIQDKSLANILVESEIGSCIPESTYEAIAAIFAFLESENLANFTKD